MNDTTYTISVILPNFNGRLLLEKNIPSIITALQHYEHEIIVVDDCSSDDSITFLNETYPDIRVIQNKENMGFSSTCNAGIYAARNTLLCIVNTDVTFTAEYFSNMTDEFKDKTLFAIKGDIINYTDAYEDVFSIDKTTHYYYKRGFIRFDTQNTVSTKTWMPDGDEHNGRQYIGLGCCFVCDRKKMLQLEGFDEIYSPFYWEDSDLALRALKHGFKLLYLPESKVYHQASSTLSKHRSNTRRKLVSNRNKFLFTWQHLDRYRLYSSHIPITVFNLLFRWLKLDWRYYAAFFWALARISTQKPHNRKAL